MKNNKNNNIRALNEAYLSHRLVIFYGAGLSKPFGLPEWKELIEDLESYYGGDEYVRSERLNNMLNNNEFWSAITVLQEELNIDAEHIKIRIAKMIREDEEMNCNFSLALPLPDNNYPDLAKMNISLFITTNYDRILSRYLPAADTTDFLNHGQELQDSFDPNSKRIIHLHGSALAPQSIIISETDVVQIYQDEFWKTSFETAANINTLLFIGVSFSDPHLKKFLQQRFKATNNPCYAIMLDGENILDNFYSPITVSKEHPVQDIRNLLTQISKEPEYLIWIKLKKLLSVDSKSTERLKSEIKQHFDVFRNKIDTYTSDEDVTFLFSHCKTTQSLQDICDLVKKIVQAAYAGKLGSMKQFVCFISKKTNYVTITNGAINTSYRASVKTILNDYVRPDSCGFIIDQVALPLDGRENWLGRFAYKRLPLPGQPELSLIVEESISIPTAENSGVEVHVAGLLFDQDRLILEERKSNEAISPGMFSLPGGRLKKGEGFREAIIRILDEKYKVSIGTYFNILDEFTVHGTSIPGIAFVGNIKTNHGALRSFSFSEFQSLEAPLACDRALIDRAFVYTKQATIKLRIIMLTDCIYCCRCCHHENVVEQYEKCDIDKIIRCIESISQYFILKQITITGGEPLAPSNRSNLLQLLDYIRKDFGNIDLSIITNAYYLNAVCIGQLKKYNVRYKISIYGYDTASFFKYTGAEKCFPAESEFDYITDIAEKLHILHEERCQVTLNIPFHKLIAPGIQTLLGNSALGQILCDYHIKIKIIEMVTPRMGNDHFSEDFEEITESNIASLRQITPSLTLSAIGERGNISIYRYPCKSGLDCRNCINQFALTVKPNGDMLICKRALHNSKIEENFFENLGINVEKIDFKDEYHF